MLRKLTLFISILLVIFFIFASSSSKILAACSSRPAIPLETKVDAGKVTITIRWDLIPSQKFKESWGTERPSLFITIFNPAGERVSAIGIEVPASQESRFIQTSGFNPGTLYRIHVTDAEELNANPPVNGSCTFEVDDPAPTFSVTTSEQPPLKAGDDCEFNITGCPDGTYCAYENMDTTKHRTCLKPPTSGEICIPEAQGDEYTGQQCVNSSCKKKGDKFICINNKLNPISTPCGTSLSGDDSNAIKKTKTKNNEGWECLNISSALGIRVYTDPFKLVPQIIEVILGFAGAIVIILIIRSGYKLMFSQGNPEKVQEAREELTSAIVGLLFIIFSFVLLQFITNDILRIQDLPKGSTLK